MILRSEPVSFPILWRRLRVFFIHVLSIAIDSLFLAVWALIQHWLLVLLDHLSISGFDKWVRLILQLIFGIATLIPVLLYVYSDLKQIVRYYRGQLVSTEAQETDANETTNE